LLVTFPHSKLETFFLQNVSPHTTKEKQKKPEQTPKEWQALQPTHTAPLYPDGQWVAVSRE